VIGRGVLAKLGDFIEEGGTKKRKAVVAAGTKVHEKVSEVVSSSLNGSVEWVKVTAADIQNVERVMTAARGASCIIGLGGGKSVDGGKLAAFKRDGPSFSVPTSASHDRTPSRCAPLKRLDRPH